jgi:hypothetical protein
MKKFAFLCALLLALAASAARAEEPFAIDEIHTYDDMQRPYAQGYSPLIKGDDAYVVLPLVARNCEGDITAEFTPLRIDEAPVKLKNDFVQTVRRKTYTFSGEKIDAYRVAFKLSLYASRLNGEYPCQITVRGTDAAGGALNQVFPIILRVTDGRDGAEAPDVGIEGFGTDEPLYVGGDGALKLTVANRGGAREARGVALTISDDSGDILPKGSDTVSVGVLAPGQSAQVEIPVGVLAKASAQPHALSVALSYGYAEGKTAAVSEKYTVEVQQAVRLHHSEAALPPRVTQGENVAFNLTLMNMGKGTLYNALLTFDVPHMAAGGSVLAGTIEPGHSAQATANLRVDADYAGDAEGTLTITWEDGYGKAYEKTLPLSTSVIQKIAPPAPGASGTEGDAARAEKLSARELVAWILTAALAALLGATAIVSGRKIRGLEEKRL